MSGPAGVIIGFTSSGIFDGGVNLIGKNLYGKVYVPIIVSVTQSGFIKESTGTFSYIYDGGLNICGINNLSHPNQGGSGTGPIYGTVSFYGLTTSALGPTGPNGTASINGLYDGGVNIFGHFDSVNLKTSIPGLTTSSIF